MDKIIISDVTLDIPTLVAKTREAMGKAYAPYSKFKVGAVVVDSRGDFYFGANIENASSGLTCCAERMAIFNAVFQGKSPVLALCVIGILSHPISPCGACRQVIREFAHPEFKAILTNHLREIKVVTMEELLPFSFGPEDLKDGHD